MKLIDVTRQFKTDDDCLDYIEAMRWLNGEYACVHCGEVGHVGKIVRQTKSKNQRTRISNALRVESNSAPLARRFLTTRTYPL